MPHSSTFSVRLAICGIAVGLAALFLIPQTSAQPGFPRPGGISGMPQNPGGISGFPRPGGISGIPQNPGGISGFPRPGGISGIPQNPGGISGFPRPGGIAGIPQNPGGFPRGPGLEQVWTCGKCGKEVARGGLGTRPPANCPSCGARLINGFGPSGPGMSPPPMNPSMPSNPGFPANPPSFEPSGPPPTLAPTPEYSPNPPANTTGSTGANDIGSKVYMGGMKSVVQVVVPLGGNRGSMGSGSVVNLKNGLILTNWHVVRGSTGDVEILFPLWTKTGRPVVESEIYDRSSTKLVLQGRVLASDQKCDLAIIQLADPGGLPRGIKPVRFASDSPLAGSKIYSIGNPAASESKWVYTPGEVRNVYRKKWRSHSADGSAVGNHEAQIIEATSPTSPGDSGGPCFNDKGEQVGVTQGGLDAKVAQGFSYFIDCSDVKAFLGTNAVAFNAVNDRAPEPSPARSGSSFFPGSTKQSSSASDSATDTTSSDSPSPSRGMGSGKIVLIVAAVLLAIGAIAAVIIGVVTGSSKPKRRPVRRVRRADY